MSSLIITITACIVLSEAALIVILIRSRRKRDSIRRELEESLKHKNLLLREIHHRLKNNLTMIGNIIRLQALGEVDSLQRRKFNEIVSRINSIGSIHEHLYTSSDFTYVSFPEYVESLLGALTSSFTDGNIETRMDIESLSLEPKYAIPLALITTELVTNAFKHGFPDSSAGHVEVSMRRDGESLVLEVSNDGKPLPEGFRAEEIPSLGFQIIRDLVRKLEGKLDVLSSGMTGFRITVPWNN